MTTLPRVCAGTCGRTLYTRHDPNKTGDTMHQAAGMCSACYQRAKREKGWKPRRKPPATITDLGPCLECKKPMVPNAVRAADRPAGTVPHGARHKCETCYARARRGTDMLHQGQDTSWMVDAACAQTGPVDEYFFPDVGHTSEAAKRMCNEVCPVREQCLAYALAVREPFGIWGGASPNERAQLRNRGAVA